MSTFSKILLVVVLSVWILGLFSPSHTSIEPVEAAPPVVPVITYDKTSVENYITSVAIEYDINPYLFTSVASCESGFVVSAFNPYDTDGKEKHGIWQYDSDTWSWAQNYTQLYGDIYDWKLSTKITALLWVDGYANKWGCWHQLK